MRMLHAVGLAMMGAAFLLGAPNGFAGRSERPRSGIEWKEPVAVPAGVVRWENSFTAAKVRAAREKKPILLLHLFGKLDEEFC